MSQTKAQIKASYPLPAYNYRVTINGDSKPLVLGFSEVSGLSIEYEPVYYKHGFSFVMGTKIIPGMRQPIKVTLKRGVVKSSDYLYKWIHEAYTNPFKTPKRDVQIDLCDETGKAVVRWKVQAAMPYKLDAPSFSANGDDIAIESLELTAQDLQVDYNPS
jgi:phage tail-like protein